MGVQGLSRGEYNLRIKVQYSPVSTSHCDSCASCPSCDCCSTNFVLALRIKLTKLAVQRRKTKRRIRKKIKRKTKIRRKIKTKKKKKTKRKKKKRKKIKTKRKMTHLKCK